MIHERTVIRMKKKSAKVIAAIFLLLLLGVSAIWFLVSLVFPELQGFFEFKAIAVVIIVTVIVTAVSLLAGHALNKKSGLIIDTDGITDHSNVTGVGFIPWKEITEIKEKKNVFGQKMFIVMVTSPEKYIHFSSRMSASRQAQFAQFGSPVIISASMLDYSTEALLELLREGINSPI